MAFRSRDKLVADGVRSPGTVAGGLVLEPISNATLADKAKEARYELDGRRYIALPGDDGHASWAVYDRESRGYRPMCHTDQTAAKRIARALQHCHNMGINLDKE